VAAFCERFQPQGVVRNEHRSVGRRAAKQMGPALLPTPLSPARGLVFRRTFRRALGARCFPFAPASRRSGSFTGARTGIRFRPRFGRSGDLPSSGETESPTFHAGHPSRTVFASTEAFAHPIDVRPECPADRGDPWRRSQAARLPPAEAFAMRSSNSRADILRHLIRGRKILRFQVFRPSIEELSVPFRCFETAPTE